MPELKDVLDDVQREVKGIGDNAKQLKESVEKDLAAVRKLSEQSGTQTAEVKQALDVLTKGVAEKHSALEALVAEVEKKAKDAADKRLDEIELKLNRVRLMGGTALGGDADREMKGIRLFNKTALAGRGELKITTDLSDEKIDVEGIREYVKSFPGYLRRDIGHQGAEQKAMSVGSDPDGGYWVTPQISNTVQSIIIESSPMRELANVETISTDALEFPIDDDDAGANWVGETESRPATSTPQVGVARIPVHEMYAFPMVTQKLLEDAAIDVEDWLATKVANKFSRLEATAFVSGNGVKKPRGFLTYPNGTTRGTIEQVVSGNANLMTPDGLINLMFSLKEPYAANASWLMRRVSVGAVMLFKDLNGQYMWRPGLEAGKPSTLLGHPVRQAADMPAVGAGTIPVAFGDFKRGYTVVDRLGITVLRDPLTAKPFVGFYTRKRVGGDVTNFEAIKLGVVSA